MRRKLQSWAAGMLLAGLLTALAGAQSLGDYARQQRAQKPATPASKVYTNDNLPTLGGLSDARAPASFAGASASKEEEKADDRGKLEADYRARAQALKDRIALLEREIQIRKDEVKWRPQTAALQYDKRFEQDDQKRLSERAEKEKELAEAQQKLEDLRDEIRKKDLPRSWAD